MASLTISGRTALAKAVYDKRSTLTLAWGTGAIGWDTVPVSPSDADTGLTAEVGRARLLAAAYVVPDAEGVIQTPSGAYTASVTPTELLYLKFDFGFEFPAGLSIREVGLFIDAIANPAVPLGQKYLVPGDFLDGGIFMATERFTAFVSDPVVGQVFQFILPF